MHGVSHVIFGPRQTHQERFGRENRTGGPRPLPRRAQSRSRPADAARSGFSRLSRRGSRNSGDPRQAFSCVFVPFTHGQMGAVRLGGSGSRRRPSVHQSSSGTSRLPLDSGSAAPGPWSARTKGPTRATYRVSRSRLSGADRRRTGSGERHRFVGRPLLEPARSRPPDEDDRLPRNRSPHFVMDGERQPSSAVVIRPHVVRRSRSR
jgi:hypothetical protein